MSQTTQYPRIHLRWDFGSEANAIVIIDKILHEINDVYSHVSCLNSNVISVYAIYELIEIALYRHLVTLRNIHLLYQLSNYDVTEPSFPEFPSDLFIYKILYSSLERSDMFLALLKFQRKCRSSVRPLLNRWLTKMLNLGRRFRIARPMANSLTLYSLERIVNDMQLILRTNRVTYAPVISLTPSETYGVCPLFLERFVKNNYAYIIRLDADTFNCIMRSAHDPETRRKVFLTYYRETDEADVVNKLVEAEQGYAKLLGYKNSAEMLFSENILKEWSVRKLYEQLSHRLSFALNRKMKDWLEHKKRQCSMFGYTFNEGLDLWDIEYFQETSEAVSYNKLSELLADYFPLNHVVKKLMFTYEHLLGLEVSEIFDFPTWHNNVRTFRVRDVKSGNKLLGYICLDLLGRKEKVDVTTYSYILQPGFEPLISKYTTELSVVAVISSFKASEYSKEINLTLLSHKEVEDLCRGVGSAFQGLCNRPVSTFYNTVVIEKDVLGVLGKFWNNFAWEPEILRCISCHYINGKPISEELLQNLLNIRYDKDLFNTAVSVYNGMIDLNIRQGSEDIDITKKTFYEYLFGFKYSKYLDFTVDNFSILSLPFPRLYYYDLWSQIVSDDLFYSRFKLDSVTNPEVWLEFRKTILEPFGTVSPYSMFKLFLGRQPDQKAFLKVRNL